MIEYLGPTQLSIYYNSVRFDPSSYEEHDKLVYESKILNK